MFQTILASPTKERAISWFRKSNDFEASVQPELPVLYRVAKRMGCTNEEAEDVVQMTLLKAFRAWDRFDGQHLRSWLIRILRNERLLELRGSKETISLDESDNWEVPDAPFWEEVSWKIQAGSVLEALETLPDIYRLAVQLCDVEDMSYEEAAEAMDVPIGTVRSRLFRARTMLRERLASVIQFEGNSI